LTELAVRSLWHC